MLIKPIQVDVKLKDFSWFIWGISVQTSELIFVHHATLPQIIVFKHSYRKPISLLAILNYSNDLKLNPLKMSVYQNNLFLLIKDTIFIYDVTKIYDMIEFENIDIGDPTVTFYLSGTVFLEKNYILIGKFLLKIFCIF